MPTAVKTLCSLLAALVLIPLGCKAQTPSPNTISPELARRIEVLIRSRSSVPPNYAIAIGPRTKSDVPGYDTISVTFSADGKTSKPIHFLLSTDGRTLAQFNKYDISRDPKTLVTDTGRPARGGPENAPVLIVGFDDLECPFCARMHEQLFPKLVQHYGNQVRIVYRDFPLVEIHPWAMHAAVDVNCLAAQSPKGYWNLVDYIHAHVDAMGGPQKSLAFAKENLDKLTTAEGERQKVNMPELQACVAKQDDTAIQASMKLGDSLGVQATPALFINGEKVEGALPIEDIYSVVDRALVAAGQKPPPLPPATAPAEPKAGN